MRHTLKLIATGAAAIVGALALSARRGEVPANTAAANGASYVDS